MIKLLSSILAIFLIMQPACSQPPKDRPEIKNPEFDEKLTSLLSFSVPVIGVDELHDIRDEVYIFDAREREEFEVSHIKGAEYLGYKNLETEKLADVPKDAKIVLYCSVGYRSEKVGEQLREMGYSNVYNLYGSIFEWVNQGYPVVTPEGKPTPKLHTYNSNWSKWVNDKKAEKVW